jgi:hypothetical protein
MVECTTGTPKALMVLTVETAFLTRSAIHRADSGQLCGLVVDEQERCVLRGEEMIGERVADRGTGHGSGTFSWQGSGARN